MKYGIILQLKSKFAPTKEQVLIDARKYYKWEQILRGRDVHECILDTPLQ